MAAFRGWAASIAAPSSTRCSARLMQLNAHALLDLTVVTCCSTRAGAGADWPRILEAESGQLLLHASEGASRACARFSGAVSSEAGGRRCAWMPERVRS